MRSYAFAVAYWGLSVFYATTGAFAALVPGRGPLTWTLRLYTRRMLWALHRVGGVKVEVAGKERLPQGAFIIAAKHHSWGDGFVMFAHVENLAFVTGDHLERIPLLRGILPSDVHVLMCFGQESVGLSQEVLDFCCDIVYISQDGSVRSLNVGCASAIAMYDYCRKMIK